MVGEREDRKRKILAGKEERERTYGEILITKDLTFTFWIVKFDI